MAREAIRVMFEGSMKTVAEIQALIPCVSNTTIRQWIADGNMPETKTSALSGTRRHAPPSPLMKDCIKGIAQSVQTRRDRGTRG